MTAVMAGHPLSTFFSSWITSAASLLSTEAFSHIPQLLPLSLFVVLVPTNLHDASVKFCCRVVLLKRSRRTRTFRQIPERHLLIVPETGEISTLNIRLTSYSCQI